MNQYIEEAIINDGIKNVFVFNIFMINEVTETNNTIKNTGNIIVQKSMSVLIMITCIYPTFLANIKSAKKTIVTNQFNI